MLKRIHAFLLEEEAYNLSIKEGDIALPKGELSPEPVLNITMTAEQFSKTSADYPESQPEMISSKPERIELPPISLVPVIANVAQSTIRAQSAPQTFPLQDMNSVHSMQSLCLMSS